MFRRWMATLFAITLLSCLFVTSLHASTDMPTRPGTVSHTISLPDGSPVVLDAMAIRSINSPYIFVADPWVGSDVLPVLAPDCELNLTWSIEVTGITATVNGTRIVIATGIRLYTDDLSHPFGAIPKFSSHPFDWTYMSDVSIGTYDPGNIPAPVEAEPSQTNQSTQLMHPVQMSELTEGPITIGGDDGVVVTADKNDFSNIFYVEDPNRAFGWKISYTGTTVVHRGDLVTVTGDVLVDDNQEAYIDATDVTVIGTGSVDPVEMIGRALGGADMDGKPGVNLPQTIGLYNKGLLVKYTGNVTYSDQAGHYCYIDDGSGLNDGNSQGAIGVKVSWDSQAVSVTNPAIITPQVGWFVSVTGISSSENPQDDDIIRVVRPRKQEDFQILTPDDNAHLPTVEITKPGSEIHKIPSLTSISITGDAADLDTGITKVEIKILPGLNAPEPLDGWSLATGTESWQYTWTGIQPGNYTIWAKTTDFSGNVGEISENVSVHNVTVVYVSPAGSRANAGASWASAKTNIDGYYGAQNVAVPDGEIWVAAGTYYENILIQKSIGIFGGFAGTEQYREQRDWTNNPTILDGNEGDVISFYPDNPNVSGLTTTIDGFTIRNGSYGIICSGSSPTIAHNVITANPEAGVSIIGPSTAIISDNTIIGNGSGIDCSACSPTITRNSITNNEGGYGAGVCLQSTCSGIVSNNNIAGNIAYSEGAGIYIDGNSTTTICNNVIVSNKAGANGGGIDCQNASPFITGNLVRFNEQTGVFGTKRAGEGGGIYVKDGAPVIQSNVIADNYSGWGGGIYCFGNTAAKLINNTVVQNVGQSPWGDGGGGINVTGGSVCVENNIIAFNVGIGFWSGVTPTMRHNDVYNNTPANYSGLTPPAADVCVNPKLADLGQGNYHIAFDSPCIDAGYDNDILSGWQDVDNQVRLQGQHVDIGADEVNGVLITLTPASTTVACSSVVTLTAHVFERATQQPVANSKIDVTVDCGSIVSIDPGSYSNISASTGSGTTDSNGDLTIKVNAPSEPQTMNVTADITTTTGPAYAQSIIYAGQRRVGLLYNICQSQIADYTDAYLKRIAQHYNDVIYDRLVDLESGVNGSYSAVFVVMPEVGYPTSAEQASLDTFVHSGRDKRIVMVGEYSDKYWQYNAQLNTLAGALDMNTRFSTGSCCYDNGPSLTRECRVANSDYLMAGVEYLWDSAADSFVLGSNSTGNPLAYINQVNHTDEPWVLEEDIPNAGSRVAIHDSSIMLQNYNDQYDTQLKANFRFIHNLCTIFPQ